MGIIPYYVDVVTYVPSYFEVQVDFLSMIYSARALSEFIHASIMLRMLTYSEITVVEARNVKVSMYMPAAY